MTLKRVLPIAIWARLSVGLVGLVAVFQSAESRPDEPATVAKPAGDSLKGKEAGEIRDDNGLKMKLVWCPPGFVRMGDTGEAPVNAFLSRGFWIGKFEVTQAEWKRVMATEPWNGRNFAKVADDIPVTWVNWDDATAFCRKLDEQERQAGRLPAGWEYTLPTEAQWERACRARTETVFSFGDDASKLGDYAWFRTNAIDAGEQYAHPVGRKKPNPWGLYDMHGNVFEWCRDVYTKKLPGGRDPETTGDGPLRIFRGGSWCVDGAYCRSANRAWTPPQKEYVALGVGFRVALSPARAAR
jgi:formylglycine-generating enzyme required for sulfatase activity